MSSQSNDTWPLKLSQAAAELGLDAEPGAEHSLIMVPGFSVIRARPKFTAFYFYFSYSKKRKQDRYLQFDPRPEGTTTDSVAVNCVFLHGLQSLKKTSMWERLLVFDYDDYELESNRKAVLEIQVHALIASLQAS